MSMVIQHNIPALQTYNIVNSTSNSLQKSIAKLSSGLRINSAADDAAGLAISEKMRSQIKGLDRAVANTQDGISMIQTAEGALSETHSILQRMRELSVQAANDTLTQQDRAYIQEEVDQLKDEITRVGNTTQFNKKKLLNGESSALWSSSDLETKALVRGSLRDVDQFGQKKSVEGNYKIRVKADPGQAEVQKSDIMTIKHPNVLTNKTVNSADGVKDVSVDNMTPGTYKMQLGQDTATYGDGTNAPTDSTAVVTGSYGIGEGDVTTSGYTHTQTIAFADHSTTALTGAVNRITLSLGSTELAVLTDTANSLIATNATAEDQRDAVNANTYGTSGSDSLEKAINDALATANIDATVEVSTDASDASKLIFKFTSDSAMDADGDGAVDNDITIKYEFYNTTTSAYANVDTGASVTKTAESYDESTTSDKADNYFTVTSAGTDGVASSLVGGNIKNGSVLFEVVGKDTDNGTVTLKATATVLDQDGKNSTATMDNIVLSAGGGKANLDELFYTSDETYKNTAGDTKNYTSDNVDQVSITLTAADLSKISENGKFVAFVTAGAAKDTANQMTMNVTGDIDKNWDDTWSSGVFNGQTVTYLLDSDSLADTEVSFKNFILNEKTGTVTEGAIQMSTGDKFTTGTGGALVAGTGKSLGTDGGDATTGEPDGDVVAAFTTAYIGKTANGDVRLRDLDKFWNSEGTFMLDDAKTLTLNQGNGNTASITLYANDTLDEVATKINNAIATDLGQSKYVDDATKFATFVSKDDSANSTNFASEAVPGTFVIRSVVPGAQGEITFSGDQQILDALSLNTIQESKETRYSVDVLDEHTGKVLAQNVKTTGNVLHGVIHENVDVEFSSLSGISAKWNKNLNKFTYDSKMEETTLHLADNTTVLQIGANEGEDLAMDIGDMRSHALGLDEVNMMSHDRAARSITVIDNAIDRVSTQRAKLGAYQNRLEYTANNLTTASENLTSAESRIRDADMAKEMMEFTKLNIMLQAGNSMLAQANQQPQNVLSLIR